MEDLWQALDNKVGAEKILGYLNLSDGRPDSRWHATLNEAYAFLAEQGDKQPWITLPQWLEDRLDGLKASSPAFKNDRQARKTLELLPPFLDAYRAFHGDLLSHLDDSDLYLPFFLARAFEVILKTGLEKGFPRQPETFLKSVLERINDFTGYRPVAILETRPSGKPYPHEWFCGIPIYYHSSGFAWGPYKTLLQNALDILRSSDPSLLHEARLELEYLDEIALDVRGYDHSHPANLRPNFFFGEWDTHCVDNQGRVRRFVLRKELLDILLQVGGEGGVEEAFDAAAVLAGTMLMASAVTGILPGTHEASASFATLIPKVARIRDTFYEALISLQSETRKERLREEKKLTRQAFGQARQKLNIFLGRKRAAHVQHRFLALMLAHMGHLDPARAEARKIEPASGRMLADILGFLRLGHVEVERGLWAQAVERPGQAFALIQRAIECGALADPWNILGFQGLFPLSMAREDSVRDSRISELLAIMDHLFQLIARLVGEAAANGDEALVAELEESLEAKAKWWDRFAPTKVQGIKQVDPEEYFISAQMVARALLQWHHRGETPADLPFWKEQLPALKSARAYATVVDLLLRKGDRVASQGLLMAWLSEGPKAPLEESPHSFHALAARWLLLTVVHRDRMTVAQVEIRHAAVRKFFEQLESNAEGTWGFTALAMPAKANKPEDAFSSAYEEMSFQESEGQRHEGGIFDTGHADNFLLESHAADLSAHLRFLQSQARLWQISAYYLGMRSEANEMDRIALRNWKAMSLSRLVVLRDFARHLHFYPIPKPGTDSESLVEYQRRAQMREGLVHQLIAAEVELARAASAIHSALAEEPSVQEGASPKGGIASATGNPWQDAFIPLERAIAASEPAQAVVALKPFMELLSKEKLIYLPLGQGGVPGKLFQVRLIQKCLDFLFLNLPRLGLVKESFDLLLLVFRMEEHTTSKGKGVSEFNRQFHIAFNGVLDTVLEASSELDDDKLLDLLANILEVFNRVWTMQSLTARISTGEVLLDPALFLRLREFIENYGQDLFHTRFMTLGNLLGVLQQGTEKYLHSLEENADPLHPIKLIGALGENLPLEEAANILTVILKCISENFEEYKDFGATSTLANYGNKLHVLLAFLRVKAVFERREWMLRPALLAHEALVRAKRTKAAKQWQKQAAEATADDAEACLALLKGVEDETGTRLASLRDRMEKGFTSRMVVDRLCAMVEPAMGEVKKKAAPRAFRSFMEELQSLAARPEGVGRDIPDWLMRLEGEVLRVQLSQNPIVALLKGLYKVPVTQMQVDYFLDGQYLVQQLPVDLEALKTQMQALLPPSDGKKK